MNNLLALLRKFSIVLLFLALEAVAIFLLVRFNGYQRASFMSSANVVSGFFYNLTNEISDYFYLNQVNQRLAEENAALKNQLTLLGDSTGQVSAVAKEANSASTDSIARLMQPNFQYVSARIIHNSVNKQQNYITLDKGALDGIQPDMGVVSSQGVVGIVKSVSDHFAMVLPLLNVQSHLSCRLDSSQNFGSLVWEAGDYRYALLKEIPSHVQVSTGETVSTSGFSSIFPAGIRVGKVSDVNLKEGDQFLEIQVELAVDFRTVGYVQVIEFHYFDELQNLQ